ncbi:hypothetical protein [Azospirillum largimobile]
MAQARPPVYGRYLRRPPRIPAPIADWACYWSRTNPPQRTGR